MNINNNLKTMYKIKYTYQTGDSFHTEERENTLEFEWEDINIVKECLKRIKEHYKWYQSVENTYSFRHEEIKIPIWHNVSVPSHMKASEHCLMNIPMDNGKEVQFWPPWCGYFEYLHGAEIITEGNTDMKFEL